MHFYESERVGVFIDGPNQHAANKALQFVVDFKRLLALFRQRGRLVRAMYYTAILDDVEYNSLWSLVDWLSYNGYSVVTKPAKEFVDVSGFRRVRGRMDVELTVDALTMSPGLDHIVLFSGDRDFKPLVRALQDLGKRVTVISTLQSKPPMVADELRRQADQFVDLADLEPLIRRDDMARSHEAATPRSFSPSHSAGEAPTERAPSAAAVAPGRDDKMHDAPAVAESEAANPPATTSTPVTVRRTRVPRK